MIFIEQKNQNLSWTNIHKHVLKVFFCVISSYLDQPCKEALLRIKLYRLVLGDYSQTCSNPLTATSAKHQNSRKIPNFVLQNNEKQMVPCKSTAEEV